MARISKEKVKAHNIAVKMLEQDTRSFDDDMYILDNFHEAIGQANNMISAHFTPYNLGRQIIICVGY